VKFSNQFLIVLYCLIYKFLCC